MVSLRNVSQYDGTPPEEGDDRRIPTDQPLYPAETIAAILASGPASRVKPVTRRARQDMQGLGWDHEDAAEAIREALDGGVYIGSEWCALGSTNTVAACDAYRFRRVEQVVTGNRVTCEYYLKWAIGKNGDLILLVSCHLSRG